MKKYWIKNKGLVLFFLLMIIIRSATQTSFEYFKGAILDSAIAKSMYDFLLFSGLFILAILVKGLSSYFYAFSFGKFRVNSLLDIRKNIFEKVIDFSFPEFLKKKRGEYVSAYTNEVDVIERSYFMSFYGFLQIILESLFSIVALFLINKFICITAIVILLPSIFLPQLLKKKIAERQTDYMKAFRIHLGKFREWLQSFEILENYGVIPHFMTKYDESNSDILKKAKRIKNLTVLSFSLSKLFLEINLLIIMAVSVYFLVQGKITTGLFITSIGLVFQLQEQAMFITMYLQQFIVANTSIKNLDDFINTPKVHKIKNKIIKEVDKISFKNIVFKFKDGENNQANKNLISDFNLEVNKTGIFVIQGESGCGKSTLMNLLMNYYELDSGEIKINSSSVSEIENLEDLITVMRQEPLFFDDSLRNNLSAYDKDISDEQIIFYLKKLGLEKYASKEGLDKSIDYKAEEFSGGQAARLSLIRSLLKNKKVLILDEPFASVDSETAEKILTEILQVENKIIFLITHILPKRLEENCEQVIKLGK